MKLVRDEIPEIIESDDETPKIHVADKEEYFSRLKDKLIEEVNEFRESNDIEELADIQEVIRAILEYKGKSFEQLEHLRKVKKEKRGGFDEGIVLQGTE